MAFQTRGRKAFSFSISKIYFWSDPRSFPASAVIGALARASLLVSTCATLFVAASAHGVGQEEAAATGVESSTSNLAPATDFSAAADASPNSASFAIVNATILSAAGPRIDNGTLLVRNGKIAAIGKTVSLPPGITKVDARGRFLTPGIIDPHSHIGANSSPGGASGDQVNESTNPGASWIENSVWVQDPMFGRALAAGVTSLQILPGSGMFNGRTFILKNVPAGAPQDMKFPNVVPGVKLACGENPSSNNPMGAAGGRPTTRAGLNSAFRRLLLDGAEYSKLWQDWQVKGGAPPRRDLTLDNVSAMLRGEARVQFHCYRADDMRQMIALSKDFGFKIAAFHHANEAFKIAPLLAQEGIAVATWAGDWSGYKMEAYDSIMETPAFIERAGGVVAMHSDDVELMQHLNHEAARAMTAGREAGIMITEDQAIRWVTLNPAKIIGIAEQTGSLETGKMADMVLWSANPFSVYSLPDQVFVDGRLAYDRFAREQPVRSDFELGNVMRRDPAAALPPVWRPVKP